jgi:hypothetical protein
MQIIPYFGEEVITASGVLVFINPDDRTRAKMVVELSNAVTQINDQDTFDSARQAAARLKAMLDEIEESKKDAKKPFGLVEKEIDKLATSIAAPVKDEQKRILGLLNGYVAKLEIAKKEKERKEAEARRLAQAEADRKVREAEEAAALAQAALRAARSEIEASKRREEATRRENQLLQEQLARDLAADVEELGKPFEPQRGLVPGGRVDHLYDFELVNVQDTVRAGYYRLLKWSLDIRACQDNVRSQLESNPDVEPTLPGIKITKRLSVSMRADAAPRIK